jgi:hypothetical protein
VRSCAFARSFALWAAIQPSTKLSIGCRFLSEGTTFISPPESRVRTSDTLPTKTLVEENGVLVEKEVMNPVQRNWCFEPNSIDAKVRKHSRLCCM